MNLEANNLVKWRWHGPRASGQRCCVSVIPLKIVLSCFMFCPKMVMLTIQKGMYYVYALQIDFLLCFIYLDSCICVGYSPWDGPNARKPPCVHIL